MKMCRRARHAIVLGRMTVKALGWLQGRRDTGTVRLLGSLTWIPEGTDTCCHEHAQQNLLE